MSTLLYGFGFGLVAAFAVGLIASVWEWLSPRPYGKLSWSEKVSRMFGLK